MKDLPGGLVDSAFSCGGGDDDDFVAPDVGGVDAILFEELGVDGDCGAGLLVAEGDYFALVGESSCRVGNFEHHSVGIEVALVSNPFSVVPSGSRFLARGRWFWDAVFSILPKLVVTTLRLLREMPFPTRGPMTGSPWRVLQSEEVALSYISLFER